MQEGFPKKFNHNRRTIQWKWKSFEIHGIWCYCNSVIIVQYWWSLTIFQWYCHNFESISNVKHLKESKPILNSLSFVCTYPCKNCNPFLKTYVCSISHDSDFLCLSFSFPAATVCLWSLVENWMFFKLIFFRNGSSKLVFEKFCFLDTFPKSRTESFQI